MCTPAGKAIKKVIPETPDAPKPAAVLPEAGQTPTSANSFATMINRRRGTNTILTGGLGIQTQPNTAQKVLLGS